jgi:hypothetical protein
MDAHCIKVAIDKDFITNELYDEDNISLKEITLLFDKTKVKYLTTFTNNSEHYRILSTPKNMLTTEEQFLQIKLRNFTNGFEIIDNILNESVSLDNIESMPDIIFSNDNQLYEKSSKQGILCLNKEFFKQVEKAKLTISTINDYFNSTSQQPFWRLRIEDRYLIKNINSENDAIKLFETLNVNDKHCLIEIYYSGNDYDYKGSKFADFIDTNERNRRIEMLKKIGNRHLMKFYSKAGHDRYFCTNSSLFIIGNSITSDKETHITYYPLIEYYSEYFKVK